MKVDRTRQAQSELKDQIDTLSAELKKISEQQACPIDLGEFEFSIFVLQLQKMNNLEFKHFLKYFFGPIWPKF